MLPNTTIETVPGGIEDFFSRWVDGWNRRDATALIALHTVDAVTINRYGTMLDGRLEAAEALGFLLSSNGPFRADVVFPPMVVRRWREVADGVAIVQVTWAAPVLEADGHSRDKSWNDMILTFCLIKSGDEWLMTQADGHNIDPMNLPFSHDIQKT